jgi:GT2 family glycosyltransferase
MVAPFSDEAVAGVGGRICTRQSGLVPRFVQLEYDSRYRRVAAREYIDFVSAAAAAYRREVFEACGGFDETLRGAEDMELSYRLAGEGHRLVYAPDAVVTHPHPTSLWAYALRKAHYGFWRMTVYGKHPQKAVADSRTPQTQKLQIGLLCLLAVALIAAPFWHGLVRVAAALVGLFLVLSLPFWWWVLRKDMVVGMLTPLFLFAGTAGAAAGVTAGLVSRWVRARKKGRPGRWG